MLICKELGADEDYQSELNTQKRQGIPYHAVENDLIQLYDGSGYRLLTFL